MFNKLKSIFTRKEPIQINDPDFGSIVFIEDVSKEYEPYWEMQGHIDFPDHKAKIQCVGILGTSDGPSDSSRKFIKSKFKELANIWEACGEELVKTMEIWYPDHLDKNPKEIFTLCGINMLNETEWEVCYEADSEYKWVFLGLQFDGDKFVSGTLDT